MSLKLNFLIPSMFNRVAPQNVVPAISIFLGKRILSEKMVPQNIFTTGYFFATPCEYNG